MKQQVEQVSQSTNWDGLSELATWVIERGIAIQQVAAPTFEEANRALLVADMFRELGLTQVSIDTLHNVYGLLPGRDTSAPGMMLSAHTDTIFPADTDLTIRREGQTIYGPGLGDNSVGVSGMLAVAAWLRQQGITPARNLWFVAPVREEGLGDLGGIKAAYTRLKNEIRYVINIEGLAFGHIYHSGIAVRRFKITTSAPGGHSWLHYGKTSAVHSLMQLGNRLTLLKPPAEPRTTLNIGLIEGGQAINAIARTASLWLDLRSQESATLAQFEAQVQREIAATQTTDLTIKVEVVGDRPAGRIPANHPLVEAALASLEQVGVRGTLETGSTDANIPLSQGCPAVTVGITRGGNAHRLDEYVETAPVASGLRHLLTLVLAADAFE
jgi:acetylornithine deacetylase/succinyl-diaminopimelate desuccinylase-like protein